MDLAADIARRVKKLSKAAVPAGGDTGRVLTKTGPDDHDMGWQVAASLPIGGAVGQVLKKTALPDGAVGWADGGVTPEDGFYGDASLTLGGGISGDADWTHVVGDAPLDVSSPSDPTAVADGLYIFSASVLTSSTVTSFSVDLQVRPGGDVRVIRNRALAPTSGNLEVSLTLAAKMTAGDDVTLTVNNEDASNSGTFTTAVTVVRIA